MKRKPHTSLARNSLAPTGFVFTGLCRAAFVLVAVTFPLLHRSAPAQTPPSPEAAPAFSPKVDRLLGVYQALSPSISIPGQPSATPATLDTLPLTPAALQAQAAARRTPAPDPKDMCQVLGPFRMMARADVKFEILRDAPNKVVLLFENGSWGNVRNLRLDAEPLTVTPHLRPLWNGDSVAKWQDEVLVVDSVHFTGKTWLNETGVVNSRQLRLNERLRIVADGKYLQYQATAVDPDILTAPVTYTRYFQRIAEPIREYNCFDHKPAP